MSVSIYLDILVAVLLAATIIYGSLLNRKLGALRSNKAELDVLIQSFNDACMRAEAGVRTLRTATDEATRLQQYLARGQMLRDDLAFLIERGTVLADRMEGNVRSARAETQSRGANGAAPSEPVARAAAPIASAAPPPAAPPPAPGAAVAPKPSQSVAELSVESMRGERAPRAARERAQLRGAGPGPEATPRSKAERELLEALRAKR
jgi:hypothetical protein